MPVNPYQAYKQQSILTMTQGEMLHRLYEEIAKQLGCAEVLIEQKEYSKANDALKKAQNILSYLRRTLDFQYEISRNLDSLYEFFIQRIVTANVKKDVEPLREVIEMVKELAETFSQAEKLARK